MLFLVLSNVNFEFYIEKLTQGSYIAIKALFITNQVEFIDKKEFAKTMLDENLETFVVYVGTLKA